MSPLEKSGSGSVEPEDFNALVDAVDLLEESPGGGISEITSEDESVVITADGSSRDLSVADGAPPGPPDTLQLVSGTGVQVSTEFDADTHTVVVMDSGGGDAVAEVSPDGDTYVQFGEYASLPSGTLTIDGMVPRGWYLRVAVSDATLGVTTFWKASGGSSTSGGSQPVKSTPPFAFAWDTLGLQVSNGIPIGFTPSPTIIPILMICEVTTPFDAGAKGIVYDDNGSEWNYDGAEFVLDEPGVSTIVVASIGSDADHPFENIPWNIFVGLTPLLVGEATIRVVYLDLAEF